MEQRGQRAYVLSGEVHVDDVAGIKSDVDAVLDEPDEDVVISLAGVERGSSVVVGLMMSWVRKAAQCGSSVSFVEVPRGLMNLITVSGLDSVLPVREGGP